MTEPTWDDGTRINLKDAFYTDDYKYRGFVKEIVFREDDAYIVDDYGEEFKVSSCVCRGHYNPLADAFDIMYILEADGMYMSKMDFLEKINVLIEVLKKASDEMAATMRPDEYIF